MTIAIDLSPEMAWALGIFEGEGCIVFDKRSPRYTISVCSTDKDVIENLHRIVNRGRIQGPYRGKLSTKDVWRWSASKADDIEHLLTLWLPWLSNRRKTKALSALDSVKKIYKRWGSSCCPQGHSWTPENTYTHVKRNVRQCRACNNIRAAEYRKES